MFPLGIKNGFKGTILETIIEDKGLGGEPSSLKYVSSACIPKSMTRVARKDPKMTSGFHGLKLSNKTTDHLMPLQAKNGG